MYVTEGVYDINKLLRVFSFLKINFVLCDGPEQSPARNSTCAEELRAIDN